MELKIIARIHTDFKTKFGVPRQSGLVNELTGRIVFEPEYRNADALRGLEGFSHIWLLWDFSEAHREGEGWSPTVRPPRLGGNKRMGVWATRSPFRPNHIGLSSVRLINISPNTPEGPVLEVSGADLMDGTPIYDIKPYLPFTDSHPEAKGGFAQEQNEAIEPLLVQLPESLEQSLSIEKLNALKGVLAADPRPHYQNDPDRIYAMEFADMEIKFRVIGHTLIVLN
ncbi:MAG: tRNA (N6-threonylcarbamoyladenosine(37)-N6)-methyltransferase TrmO [Bacteroidaceae bacterium]|jgi:tRNA-Thr(GGU) m(6)t(6)A37 methyltransferase TsaA|nr:tRNA (N6-threonylcarbamoyladenosine(37)-N6)-methyltransferase TrmO [Bacteroidaceae bacterium]MBQ5656835.1 tRNA (N6-threonylcarbamoyladenosine(37)-N6)-methyltransferase TrmO [Bacteroidaceae bacterium]